MFIFRLQEDKDVIADASAPTKEGKETWTIKRKYVNILCLDL